MKRFVYLFFFVLTSQVSASASIAPSHDFKAPSRPIQRSGQIDSRLRSAFLLRAIGTPQEYSQANATGLRSQLQTHFDAVLEIMEANRERSLSIALTRLEDRQGIRWTPSQREYWYRYLSKKRDENLQRLAAYRDRGLFPLNEGHAAQAVPIFVDQHDTACAVGHLMRESGWEREVELIETTNLFVYVTDVRTGPLVNWVLQSGLTQGEAALIQPAYAPPILQIPLSSLSGPGSGFTAPATFFNGTDEQTIANGLRYENFVFRRGGVQQAPSDIGVRTDYEVIDGRYDPECGFCFSDYYAAWPYANLLTLAPGADTYAISQGLSEVSFSFDVVANHPALAIDRVGSFIANGFSMGEVEASTDVSLPPNNLLATLNVAPIWNDPLAPYEDSVTFSPAQRVTVHSVIYTQGASVFGAISHEIRVFYLAPEPSSLLLLSFVSVAMVICRRGI